jgi:hypothetical protein
MMSDDGISLELENLLDEAHTRSGGLEDLGAGPFLKPLGRLVESLEGEARLNTIGRVIARERILSHTVNRLGYTNDRKQFPGIATQNIVKPIFIIGLPRTGTTILHDILAQDAKRLKQRALKPTRASRLVLRRSPTLTR